MDKSNIETSMNNTASGQMVSTDVFTTSGGVMMAAYKTEWVEEDRKRSLDMQRWYVLDGRHRPDHPQNGVYTGLSEIGAELDRFDEEDAA